MKDKKTNTSAKSKELLIHDQNHSNTAQMLFPQRKQLDSENAGNN